MKNKHLTAAQRGAIEVLLQRNCTLKETARILGVSSSTVSREIKKRETPKGYLADIAQLDYERRRKKSRQKKKMDDSPRQKYVCAKLQLGWSPEQISGRMKYEGRDDLYVCPESIYQWLYGDEWAKGEGLYQYLRLGRKKRKKQTGRGVHRFKIPNRVSIHDRPRVVDQRTNFGHWEGDSVIYPNKYVINTLNELCSGLVKFTKLRRKTAELTTKVIIERFKKIRAKTLTLDNGSEFAYHEQIAKLAEISVFFADPYASWQRGSNENSNMLLRGYLPKRSDISDLDQEELEDIAEELNDRPRKRLDFRTPNEVYYEILQKGEKVALGSRM
jgi:IS30 family transposase